MPKRKATEEHSPHERPPRKKRKGKASQLGVASDGGKGRKAPVGAAAEGRETVSANWQSLRMVWDNVLPFAELVDMSRSNVDLHVCTCYM